MNPDPGAAGVPSGPLRFRPAGPADSRAMWRVFRESINEIDRRLGSADAIDDIDDPALEAEGWEEWRSLFDHIAATVDLAWLAEDPDGRAIGYARSILRDGDRELTEFFVRPGAQRRGVGGELLARAFPAEGARHRSIIATLEPTALARYLNTGLTARCLVLYVSGRPSASDVATELVPEALTDAVAADIDAIDAAVIGHSRRADHRWLLAGRTGIAYRREGRIVAYGYVGRRSGPVAVLDRADTPAVLADLETRAAAAGVEELGLWLPSVNREAAAYLLGRRYRIDPFVATFFSDDPNVELDRYLITSPPFFL